MHSEEWGMPRAKHESSCQGFHFFSYLPGFKLLTSVVSRVIEFLKLIMTSENISICFTSTTFQLHWHTIFLVLWKKPKYKSPHAFCITSRIFGSNHHICSVFLLFSLFHTKNAGPNNCSHQLWTPFHVFVFPRTAEVLCVRRYWYVPKGTTCSLLKEQFAVYRVSKGTTCNLQVHSFYLLLALSWAVDTDGDFCGWPQMNSSDPQEGWNVCLMTHPCTLFSCPCLLYLSDIRKHLLKTRQIKGVSKPTALQNNGSCSQVTCHRELDQGKSV